MKILQLCHKPPYPPIDGGTKAMHYITRGLLQAGHEVKVLCLSTQKHALNMKALPSDYLKATKIEGIFVDTTVNLVDAFTDLLTADNYNVSRFFSPDMDIRLIQLLSEEKFDIIHMESLFMSPYIDNIRRYSTAPIVLRSHNLEHVIQERIAHGEKNFLKRPYRKFLAKQLKEHEMQVLDRVDAVAAISPADAEKFIQHGTTTPIVTIPFGVDMDDYEITRGPSKDPIFFHLGSMDWQPNEEGIRWLLDKVWPRVKAKYPKARLHLAGNKMPADLLKLQIPNAKINGRVRDATKYMSTRDVMLVPLHSGGGMRVKIIEGMALNKAIIATPIGAEGIDVEDGKSILLARTATEFVQQIGRLIEEPELCVALGNEGRKVVSKHYAHHRIVKDLIALYRSLNLRK